MTDPNEEQASSAPLVTVIYGDNSLGDRSYCDMIYEGVELTAQYAVLVQGSSGSHVHIVNSTHFGNLYTTGPQEFFVSTTSH